MKVPLPVVRAWCNLLHRGRYRRYAMGDDIVITCRRCKRRMLMVKGQMVKDQIQREGDFEEMDASKGAEYDAEWELTADDMPFEDG